MRLTKEAEVSAAPRKKKKAGAKKTPATARPAGASKSKRAATSGTPAGMARGDDQVKALKKFASDRGVLPPLEKQLAEEAAQIRAADGADGAEDPFDAAAKAEQLGIWWLNGGDRYFLPDAPKGEQKGWLELGIGELRRLLKVEGVRVRPREGESVSQLERLLVHTMRARAVDYAVSIAGSNASVCQIGSARVLIRDSPRLITPKQGDFQVVMDFLDAVLGVAGQPQVLVFLCWLKVALESLYAGERRSGQCLILVGPSDCGKSRVQHQLITPLLGNRAADPKSFFFGRTDFNSELIGSEHLLIEEIPSGTRYDDRQFFGERIKEVVANDGCRLHKKNRDAVNVMPFWRLTISLNDSKLNVLPSVASEMRDKLLVMKARTCPEFYDRFADAADPRRAFREAIAAALPAFVFELLNNFAIPLSFRGRRFGVVDYQHPDVLEAMFEQEHESLLLLLIDKEIFKDRTAAWEGDMQDLKDALTSESSCVSNSAKRLTADLSFLGTLVRKLMDQMPARVQKGKRSADKRPWIIQPPAVAA